MGGTATLFGGIGVGLGDGTGEDVGTAVMVGGKLVGAGGIDAGVFVTFGRVVLDGEETTGSAAGFSCWHPNRIGQMHRTNRINRLMGYMGLVAYRTGTESKMSHLL